MKFFAKIGLIAAFVLLLALALWLRFTSLGALPGLDGDEAWHAVQLVRMIRGQSFSVITEHGLPLSPFHAALELPLLLARKPSLWVLRAPAAITGVLAVILTYVLGSRMLDRTTALIASGLLAVLPVAVLYSRTGYESSHAPLYGIVIIYLAHRERIGGLCLLLACSPFVHPTNIFLLPLILAILLARSLARDPGDRSSRWRGVLARMAWPSSVVLAIGLFNLMRPLTQRLSDTHQTGLHGPHDWFHYWALFGRLLLGTGRVPRPWHDGAFWACLLALLVLGVGRLVRDRRWERLSLVVGLFLSASAFFVVGGSNIIQPGTTRYGLFLVVPTVLAVACLVRGLLVEPSSRRLVAVRRLQFAGLLAVGWLVLLDCKLQRVDHGRVFDAVVGTGERRESIWTFGLDAIDPRAEALQVFLAGREGLTPRPTAIVCDGWDHYWLVAYLCLDRTDVEVIDFDAHPGRAFEAIRSGGAVFAPPGGRAERSLRSVLPAVALQREVLGLGGERPTLVSRRAVGVAATRPAPADFDGDGRADRASYDPDSGRWTIVDAEGRPAELTGPIDGIPAPGDYDGDGRAEPVVYQPGSGGWFAIGPDGPSPMVMRPIPGGIPAPGDYDGDGRDEPAVFHPSRSTFLQADPARDVAFGQGIEFGGDPIPAPADYDGDGRADIAVYQADSGTWFLLRSREGAAAVPTGREGGLPVPGDLDGDGRADLVLHRPDPGTWEVVPIDGGAPSPLGKAAPGLVAAGDFDGDGRLDLITAFDDRFGEWSGPLSGGGRLSHRPEGMRR